MAMMQKPEYTTPSTLMYIKAHEVGVVVGGGDPYLLKPGRNIQVPAFKRVALLETDVQAITGAFATTSKRGIEGMVGYEEPDAAPQGMGNLPVSGKYLLGVRVTDPVAFMGRAPNDYRAELVGKTTAALEGIVRSDHIMEEARERKDQIAVAASSVLEPVVTPWGLVVDYLTLTEVRGHPRYEAAQAEAYEHLQRRLVLERKFETQAVEIARQIRIREAEIRGKILVESVGREARLAMEERLLEPYRRVQTQYLALQLELLETQMGFRREEAAKDERVRIALTKERAEMELDVAERRQALAIAREDARTANLTKLIEATGKAAGDRAHVAVMALVSQTGFAPLGGSQEEQGNGYASQFIQKSYEQALGELDAQRQAAMERIVAETQRDVRLGELREQIDAGADATRAVQAQSGAGVTVVDVGSTADLTKLLQDRLLG